MRKECLNLENSLENIKNDLIFHRERIEVIRASLLGKNAQLKHDLIQTSRNNGNILDGIIKIMEHQGQVMHLTQRALDLIHRLDSKRLKDICILFYIGDVEADIIAHGLNCSRQHVYKLLKQATDQLSL